MQNIDIDQVKRLIIITIPQNFMTPFSEEVNIGLTQNTKLVGIQNPATIDFCAETIQRSGPVPITPGGPQYNIREILVESGAKRKAYTIEIKNAGDMFFANADQVYQLKSDYPNYLLQDLTVYNYVDVSKGEYFAKLIYTHIETGEQSIGSIAACGASNRIYIPAESTRLGAYTVRIEKPNGRKTTNVLRFVMNQGKLSYYGFYCFLDNNPTKTISIAGSGLFDGNNIEVEFWHSRTGERYKLKAIAYDKYGKSITIPQPQNLKPGYYYTKIYQNGQVLPEVWFSNVFTDYEQPRMVELYTYPSSEANKDFFTLKRGNNNSFWYSPDRILPIQIRLKGVQDSQLDFTIDATVPKTYGNDPGRQYYPTFVVPVSVPAGRYLFSLQYKNADGSLKQGEPFLRDAVIE